MRKNPAAVALGKRRAAKLTKAERRELAGKAGRARWAKATLKAK